MGVFRPPGLFGSRPVSSGVPPVPSGPLRQDFGPPHSVCGQKSACADDVAGSQPMVPSLRAGGLGDSLQAKGSHAVFPAQGHVLFVSDDPPFETAKENPLENVHLVHSEKSPSRTNDNTRPQERESIVSVGGSCEATLG